LGLECGLGRLEIPSSGGMCGARSAHGRVGRGSAHDTPDLLALYMPEGSPLRFAADFFGARHPWSYTDRWRGHRCSSCSAPEMRSVLVFWAGEKRTFAGWYVNLQEPFRRTWLGIDTQDLEIDIVVSPDGSWRYKGRRADGAMGSARTLDVSRGRRDPGRGKSSRRPARKRLPLVARRVDRLGVGPCLARADGASELA
jgi:uncharacterized protein DUF402